jgi:hypothetical protein
MEMNGQLHAPAALPAEKQHPLPIEYEAGWASEPVWTLCRRVKSLSPTGNGIALYRLSYRSSVQVKVVSVSSDSRGHVRWVTSFQWGRRCRDFPSSLLNTRRCTGVDNHYVELSLFSDLNFYVAGPAYSVCTFAGLRLNSILCVYLCWFTSNSILCVPVLAYV